MSKERERSLALFDALEAIPLSTIGQDYRQAAADLIEAAMREAEDKAYGIGFQHGVTASLDAVEQFDNHLKPETLKLPEYIRSANHD